MDRDSVNLLLHNNWVRNFDRNLDWVGNLNFFNYGDFHDFIFWDFFVVMFVNCMDRNVDAANMMFPKKVFIL